MGLFTRGQRCYIMSVPSGYVKVGISDDVNRRLREVQAQFYEEVSFIMATHLSARAPICGADLEKVVHTKLRPYSTTRREWFKVHRDTVFDVLLTAYWFLATPPEHKDFESVHPAWVGSDDIDAHDRAALHWGAPGAPGHEEICKRFGCATETPRWAT